MKKILIIEDDPSVMDNLNDILRFEGYDVLMASDGGKGISIAQENLPDLIISDIMMPVKNGYEVLKELQSQPETYAIPFLFLSARTEKKDIRFGMELGADDYIFKPVTADKILNSVKMRLKKTKKLRTVYEEKLEKLRKTIAFSLPHELNTPLNSIMGFTQILINGLDDFDKDDVVNMLKSIHESGERLSRLFMNYSFYIQLLEAESEKKSKSHYPTLSTQQFIEAAVDKYSTMNNRQSDVKLSVEDTAIELSDQFFNKICEELLDNAFKFSEQGDKVLVTSYLDDDRFIFSVEDDGHGIESSKIDEIGAFSQFNREHYEQQGVGLGLTLVRKITQIYNIDLEIEKNRKSGFKISLKFPLYEK